jgi:hypothetical protein
VWLDLIGLSQYDQALNDAGYDDIDFISDITSEELEDIGITKKGGCGRHGQDCRRGRCGQGGGQGQEGR